MNRSIRNVPAAGLSCTLALLLFFPVAMRAQNAPPPPAQNAPMMNAPMSAPSHPHRMNPKKQLRHLTRKLNLSPAEQQEILPILQDQDHQLQSLRKDQSFTRQVRRQQWYSIHVTTQQKIKAVLNDTQKKQFDAMLAKRRQRMQARRQQRMQQNGASPANGAQPAPPANNGSQPPVQ